MGRGTPEEQGCSAGATGRAGNPLEAPVGAWLAARRGTGGRGFRRAVPLHVRNRLDTQGEGKVDDGERVMKAGVGEGRDLGGRRGSGILQEQARRLYDDGLRRGRQLGASQSSYQERLSSRRHHQRFRVFFSTRRLLTTGSSSASLSSATDIGYAASSTRE